MQYLKQMQELREEQQQNALEQRLNLDTLNDEYRQAQQQLAEDHRNKVRDLRNAHTERQHDVERRMNELKMAWFEEHPYTEVQVM